MNNNREEWNDIHKNKDQCIGMNGMNKNRGG